MPWILADFGHRMTTWFGHGQRTEYAPARRLERRRAPRFPSCLSTTCDLVTTGASPADSPNVLPARIHDVSANGIRLTVDRCCAHGSLLHVPVPRANAAQPTRLLACVIRVLPDAGETWSLGCSFIRELKDVELQALV